MKLALSLLLLAGAPAFAQSLPDAPRPAPDRITTAFLAVDGGIRSLDVYSTQWGHNQGNCEAVLPTAIGNHPPVMAIYSAGVVAVDTLAAHWLIRRGHPKLARLAIALDAGQDGYFAIRNLTLPPGCPKAAHR